VKEFSWIITTADEGSWAGRHASWGLRFRLWLENAWWAQWCIITEQENPKLTRHVDIGGLLINLLNGRRASKRL